MTHPALSFLNCPQKVTRHVWYVLTPGSKGKYIPVDEEKALILEWTYQVKYKADSVDHMHRVKFPSTGEEALFVADDDIYLFPKPWFSSFGPKDVKKGQRLSRGYKQTDWQLREQTARDNIDGPIVCGTSDSADELTHVLFVVHGIGQAMEAVDITDDTNMLRGRMHAMATRFHNNLHGKFLVIPVQWRKGLQFNSENETSIDDITVDGCRGLREMIHSTALDVLFYTNPRTCQLIFSELGTRLLELHEKFTLRHPGFVGRGGKFSIFGHSLGSVLSYDLLSHQHGGVNIDTSKDTTPVTATELAETIPSEYLVDCATDSDELRNAKEQIRKFKATVDNDLIARQQRIQPPPPATNDPFPGCADDSSSLLLPPTHAIGTGTHRITYDVQYPQLPFEVDTLILSGSPIAVFMQVKQLRLKKGNTNSLQSTGARPLVCKLYNLFYPYDPVAYRLEPLLDSSFRSTRPSIVYYYAGGLRLHTAVSQTVEGLGQNILGAKLVMDKGFAQIAKSMTFNMGASKEKELELKRNRTADLERLKRVQQEEQLQLAQSILQTANPDKRLDFMLQDSPVENAYLAAISSHFRYWGDNDVGLFVLSKMFELPDPIDE
ncbi:hypothetical protein SARC_03746 [Sphaeroforma arctica JP610]|uniref:DDHD domain-containing protein n=1 Tax=Sphaeroforma arctica JP610 TaxID=667725 RepID=A0A0L0G5E1_9EUKA|nr:hypothetical protein SARC_03746 [Sphaeroforma arctica JP610]KNC84036.1 hypothetical protein SARC_03746 [Sphaeroforma arctica JP610]|eukprot:XP_014157938.1 hypothetical protein SARC_03746 [Sphaeroforma arctica JP610]